MTDFVVVLLEAWLLKLAVAAKFQGTTLTELTPYQLVQISAVLQMILPYPNGSFYDNAFYAYIKAGMFAAVICVAAYFLF